MKKRIAALLMVNMMIFTLPLHALAAGSPNANTLCEHHIEHTADCGYTESMEGTPCAHNHTEDCFHPTTSCSHEHGPECYPEDSISANTASPSEIFKPNPTGCKHQCSKNSGCIIEELDCQHEHDETCGYTEKTEETPCTFVCNICHPADQGNAEHDKADEKTDITIVSFDELPQAVREQSVLVGTSLQQLNLPTELCAYRSIYEQDMPDREQITLAGVVWKPDKTYQGEQEQGKYVFTATLPEGYSLMEGVQLPIIEVSVSLHISATDSKPIIYKDGVHYIEDTGQLNEYITLFCMNNKLHWPHYTPELGDTVVPEYIEGYLTEDDFESPEKYKEFLRRVSNLLYAGYPHNGAQLYEIVSDGSMRIPTVEEFNKMLIPSPQLADDFPKLKHYKFTYPATQEQIDVLADFVRTVARMPEDGTTSGGLPKRTILCMPFYKAANCLITEAEETPLEVFSIFYGGSYFLTEKQAYDATQLALWKLLNDYGVADNDIGGLNGNESAMLFMEFSEYGEILTYQPKLSELKLEGEMTFSFNAKDGRWHSEPLTLVEPEHYHGLYELTLPDGVTTLHNLTHVYGNEEYELVSDHEVGRDETFAIKANIAWLKDFKQYSPSPDIEVNGKKFQHMAGSVIEQTALYAQFQHNMEEEGSLSVSKILVGNNTGQSFVFQLWFPDKWISGVYGDMEFTNGFTQFELKHGETKTATHLPAGEKYYLAEITNGDYYIESENNTGIIPKNQTIAATFTNIPLPELTVGKVVTGEQGDPHKVFTFTIELKDKNGKPVSGFFEYWGTVIKSGHTDKVEVPEDGELNFVGGKAQVKLSHGQQITLISLPYQSAYTITEQEENEGGYITTYNGNANPETGTLTGNKVVLVENHKGSVPEPKPEVPENPDTEQPDEPTPEQPDKPTPEQPDKPTPEQPDKPTPEQPDKPTPEQPDKPTPEQPDKPTPEQPDKPTPEQPDKPTSEQPNEPTPEQPDKPTPEQPDKPTPEIPQKEQPAPNIPQTGDHTGIIFWIIVLCISFAGFFTILVRNKQKNHSKQ